jgi:hypothetical protein
MVIGQPDWNRGEMRILAIDVITNEPEAASYVSL